MSLIIGRFARYAARRIAASPKARDFAVKAAKGVADEAKAVAKEEDKARAAGRSVRRIVNSFRNPGSAPDPKPGDDGNR